ncbi:MAG: VOC family protein [Chloroflexi bacterium]|nr:VOC family protein [Chloroflexota bacterium]
MITGIDHIVIAVKSLERAIKTYRGLGFTVVEGGKHPYGSYNALIGFADGSYIELLGFYEESPDHPWWDLLHERGGGLVDFCLATDDIRADHAAFRAQGVECSELVEGGRSRPDGYTVKWINNKVMGEWQGLIPFIIEDLTPREERLPRETAHANGVTGIDRLSFATNDVARYAGVMSAVTGAAGETVRYEVLSARGLRLAVGEHALEYLTPDNSEGPLAAHLAENRPAPYRVRFKTTGEARRWSPDEAEGLRAELVRCGA